jgi:TonB family protein
MQRTYLVLPFCLFFLFVSAIAVPRQNQNQPISGIEDWINGAENGNDTLQYELAKAYQEGRWIPKSKEEALKWYRRAADQGNINAQSDLGKAYQEGRIFEKNEGEALFWHRKAAEQGNLDSQFAVGSMYLKGQGTPPDYIQAYMWLDLCSVGSVDKPNKEAAEIRDSLAEKMTSEQIAEARRLANEWTSGYAQRWGNGPYRIGWGVTAPKGVNQPLPTYTDEARQAKVEGKIFIEMIIRKDGTIEGLKLLKGLGYGLDEAAIDIISKKWRFSPGTFQGKPVDVKSIGEVSFRFY